MYMGIVAVAAEISTAKAARGVSLCCTEPVFTVILEFDMLQLGLLALEDDAAAAAAAWMRATDISYASRILCCRDLFFSFIKLSSFFKVFLLF